MNEKMRSAQFVGKDKDTGFAVIKVVECDKPEVDDDKLLVHIDASGLCTYEQRVYKGTHKVEYPFVGGHEVAGTIEKIGKNLEGKGWNIGDKVVVGVTLPCRNCYFCKTNNEQNCTSFSTDVLLPGQPCKGSGGLSEYMMSVPDCVFKYYNVEPTQACISEPLSCCIHSVETANPQFGDTCVIVGAGIMGLLHLELCLKKGTNTIVLDLNDERLDLAKQIGANYVINSDKENAEDRIKDITHGIMAQCVFDTTPFASVVEEAIKYVGNCGKLVIYSGIYPNKEISINPHWVHKSGAQILGTANSNDRDFMRATSMISNGIIDVKKFISNVYPVEQIEDALKSAIKGDKFRNIVVFK